MGRAQKVIAIVQGALEGLQESLEHENLGEDAARVVRQARGVGEAVSSEAREIGRDPDVARVGEKLSAGASAVSERTSAAASNVKDSVADTRDRIVSRVEATVDDVKAKGAAVRESASRAREAPRMIMTDVKDGAKGYVSNAGAGLGLFALAAALGVTFLVVFAIWLTVALVRVLGDPLGTLVSALVFLVATVIVGVVARSRFAAAGESVKQARTRVREDVDYVKRPVAREFGARRT